MNQFEKSHHVVLTSHSEQIYKNSLPVKWGEKDPLKRGPIVATLSDLANRNAIGTHSGSYTVYRALSIAQGSYPKSHRPDLRDTEGTTIIGPYPSWFDSEKILSLDPFGAQISENFGQYLDSGYNIQPTIAVTQAHLNLLEIKEAISKKRLKVDNSIVFSDGRVKCSKAAIEPVWYLPGIAQKFGISEGELRNVLFEETGGMFPELVTRPDLKVLLPQ